MSHDIRLTIRLKITLITVSFSLAIAVLLSALSFGYFRTYARRSVIQSVEFNLQLIAGTFGQELVTVNTLSRWSTTNAQLSSWLADANPSVGSTLDTFERLQEELRINRSNVYVRRFIVTSAKSGKLMQAGSNMGESWPVTVYNISKLGLDLSTAPSVFRTCEADPYSIGDQVPVIPIIRPICGVGSTEIIGHSYLALSSDTILSRLVNYHIAPGGNLYLSLPGAVYRIDGEKFTDVSAELLGLSERKEATLGLHTIVREVSLKEGGSLLMVTCPAGVDGVYLSQSVPPGVVSGNMRVFAVAIAVASGASVLFGAFISFLLNRVITQPVFRLRKKIDGIAASDFSPDPGIEWDNELGDIGRGINTMSGKIVSLLESRLADERKKRDLEYRMLQSQINPHFLYNSLNSIKWMATLQNATGIAEMTTALSRLMRNAIKGSRTVVALHEELALLDDYFVIQRYRYGAAIKFVKDVPESLRFVSLPCFSLQPLMENAIFHGIEPKGGSGTIVVSASRTESGDVEICMEDDGVGMPQERIAEVLSTEGGGAADGFFKEIGVASVDRRIVHSYGSGYGLRVESEEGAYTRMIIRVPYLTINAPETEGVFR